MKHQTRPALRFCLLGLTVAAGCTNGPDSAPVTPDRPALVQGTAGYLTDYGVTCTLASERKDGAEAIRMTLTNDSKEPVELLTRYTAWDIGAQVFDVEGAKMSAPYVGIMASRGAPSEQEMLAIAPGKSVSTRYALGPNHRVYEGGRYSATLRSAMISLRVGGELELLTHDCGKVELELEPQWGGAVGVSSAALTYDGTCSASQKDAVETVKPVVRGMLDTYAEHVNASDAMYTEWFGAYTSARANAVSGVLGAIDGDWDQWNILCDAGACATNPWNAYVSSAEPGNVYLCAGWFTLDSIAYEEWSNKSGTLIHELSHSLGGTDDKTHASCTDNGDTGCYGPVDARGLAIAAPDVAVDNAENYEHFAANLYVTRIMAAQPL